MKKYLPYVKEFMQRADMFLLALCIISSLYGLVVISSATQSYSNSAQYVIVQLLALFIGIFLYVVMTVIDVEILADKWLYLSIFNVLFMGSLLIFGVTSDTGNSGWLRFMGIGIQPSEIVKITYIIIMARQISHLRSQKNGINSVPSVLQLVVHFGAMFVLLLVTSKDLGSALVYFFIFAVMLFVAGLKIYWFLIGLGAIAAVTPILWNNFLADYQKNRILAPYDASIDPENDDVNWQPHLSKVGLASGQLTGTGLGNGTQSQSNSLFGKHTDFIFSVIGEELGMIGCLVVFALLMTLVVRCVYVGIKSKNELGMLVCFGVAATVVFQTFENTGMCIGIAPVIGITLPFFSYGGSSLVAMFAAMGMVSGVRYRPKPERFSVYS